VAGVGTESRKTLTLARTSSSESEGGGTVVGVLFGADISEEADVGIIIDFLSANLLSFIVFLPMTSSVYLSRVIVYRALKSLSAAIQAG
jgi:hypothetical protein